MKKYISSFLIAMLCLATAFAQTDSRNRVASTVIADGLAQLPAKNTATFGKIISEMAATGEEGILQIAKNLKPAGEGVKNAVFEYALSGITDYAASKEGENTRASVRTGLLKAVESCSDETNKAFLLTLLKRVATTDDFDVFAKYLSSEKLSIPALAAIEAMPNTNAQAAKLIATSEAVPAYSLAKIAERKNITATEVEDRLITWAGGNDSKTLIAVYDAMAATGTAKSLKVLEKAAKASSYTPEASHALDAYVKILDRCGSNDQLAKAAKALGKSSVPAVRCAGLRMLLKSSGTNGSAKVILKALKDGDIQYRNTALLYGEEFAGKDIYGIVAKNYSSLSDAAKTDVVRWLGNNHCKQYEDVMLTAVASNDSTLSCSAMEALAKTGSSKALEALVSQLGGKNGAYASSQLLAFNGDIASGILSTLKGSKDSQTLVSALQIAGQRHIHSAYSEVEKLTASSDAKVSEAAYDALSGVAASSPEYAGNIAALLEKSSGTATEKLQKALCNSLVAQSGADQYAKAAQMLKGSSHPEYFYPLLAQSGTSEAIADLQKALENSSTAESAAKSMLLIDNAEVIPVLRKVAVSYPAYKDQLISRDITLIDKYIPNNVTKYQHLLSAYRCAPSSQVVSTILSDLGNVHNVQSLAFLANSMDNAETGYAAALSVKNIVAHSDELNAGDDVLKALDKAKSVAQTKKNAGDADAGYAIDEIAGIVAKHKAGSGYTLNQNSKQIAGGEKFNIASKQENIAFTFDWKAEGEATVKLRSQAVLRLTSEGVEVVGTNKKFGIDTANDFNSLEVKLVDDRIFVTSNAQPVLVNTVFKEATGAKAGATSGDMEIVSTKGNINISNFNVNKLAPTPVYTLSDEEKKAGFEVLFDGRSLEKWQGNTTNYTPDNGTIYVTANYGGSGNLYTQKKYSDFVYRFEFCFEVPGVNNGIGIRTNIGSDAAYDGMEIQVLDHDDPIYADLLPYQQHGSVYGIHVPKHVTFGKLGTWNTMEVRAEGDHIKVTVNGDVVSDCDIRKACQGHNIAPDGSDKNPYTVDHKNHPGLFNKDGYVSFCGHGAGVRFRNVRILDLSKNKTSKTGKKTNRK